MMINLPQLLFIILFSKITKINTLHNSYDSGISNLNQEQINLQHLNLQNIQLNNPNLNMHQNISPRTCKEKLKECAFGFIVVAFVLCFITTISWIMFKSFFS
ncbi:hypothetical protein HERIO_2218 [Hepatospora eriocheir]|uniref:Transmembrane protein n=1 Tax=Hepatospora eriocheir TaxID=1081669 RepID=A0A1X0Q7P0_9MICR|nr:hypothetical protein HERIO_2218 [Hepatospora eriocheir]